MKNLKEKEMKEKILKGKYSYPSDILTFEEITQVAHIPLEPWWWEEIPNPHHESRGEADIDPRREDFNEDIRNSRYN